MSSCDNTVLTGQEGLIQFKPLGTTNCVDDYCPFAGDRIYLPCSADYDVDDCIEVERVKIPSGEGVSYDGGTTVIADGDTFYVVNDGKGVAGDVDATAATTWRVFLTSKCLLSKAAARSFGTPAWLASP